MNALTPLLIFWGLGAVFYAVAAIALAVARRRPGSRAKSQPATFVPRKFSLPLS